MKKLFVSLALAGALTTTVHAAAAHAAKPDPKAVAEKIVGDVASVQEGEVVWIDGNVVDAELAEEVALAVQRRGGVAYVELGRTGALRRYLAQVPAKYDAMPAKAALQRVALEDVLISLSRIEDFNEVEGVDPARLAARAATFSPLMDARMKARVRSVEVGNGLFPTAAAAKALGVSQPDLDGAFWGGLNTDYKKLAARGAALQAAVQPGKELSIKSKAGTDLKVKLKPIVVSDGVISPEEQKAGGTSLLTWLPAGEAFGLTEPGSADGTVVTDVHFRGKTLKAVTFTFKGGKLVDMKPAKPSADFDTFKAAYDAGTPGKDALSIVDFGINPDVKHPKGKVLRSYVVDGTVTVIFGADQWAGGTNGSSWGYSLFLTDATVTVDGKTLVDNGALKLDAK